MTPKQLEKKYNKLMRLYYFTAGVLAGAAIMFAYVVMFMYFNPT